MEMEKEKREGDGEERETGESGLGKL